MKQSRVYIFTALIYSSTFFAITDRAARPDENMFSTSCGSCNTEHLESLICCLRNELRACCAQLSQEASCCCDFTINQSMIPFTITNPGTYCIEENLSYAVSAPAITVSTDDVRLDFKGHQLTKTVPGEQALVVMNGFSDIDVFGGWLSGGGINFVNGINTHINNMIIDLDQTSTGINLDGCQNAQIDACTLTGGWANIAASNGAKNIDIADTLCQNAAFLGIALLSNVDRIHCARCVMQETFVGLGAGGPNISNVVLENCAFYLNSVGFAINTTNNVVVNNCISDKNLFNDCAFINSTNITVDHLIANNAQGLEGITFQGSSFITVRNCTTNSNTLNGLTFANCTDFEVDNHVSKANGRYGIYTENGRNFEIHDSVCDESQQDGLVNIGGLNFSIIDSSCYANGLGNLGGHGIYMHGAGMQLTSTAGSIINCICTNNAKSGFELNELETCIIRECKALNNTDYGFHAAQATSGLSVSHCEASGNGNVGFFDEPSTNGTNTYRHNYAQGNNVLNGGFIPGVSDYSAGALLLDMLPPTGTSIPVSTTMTADALPSDFNEYFG